MNPTKTEIITFLKTSPRATDNPGWLAHSLAVGDTAGKIAVALNETYSRSSAQRTSATRCTSAATSADCPDQSVQETSSTNLPPVTFPLDVEKIVKMGYLHDVGKIMDPAWKHPVNGYHYLKDHGYPEEYYNVCMVHHFINNDPNCTFSTIPDPAIDKEMVDFLKTHQFTFEEKLIALCDAMCITEVTTLDKRITDVLVRHGTNPHTGERIRITKALKQDIDHLLGYNLYELFPEIKENL